MDKNTIACCANCKHCLEYPRGNRYGDIDYMCAINGYFMHSINKDISKIKHFTPGGRELECRYERKNCLNRYSTGKKEPDIVEISYSTDLIQCHSRSVIHSRK